MAFILFGLMAGVAVGAPDDFAKTPYVSLSLIISHALLWDRVRRIEKLVKGAEK